MAGDLLSRYRTSKLSCAQLKGQIARAENIRDSLDERLSVCVDNRVGMVLARRKIVERLAGLETELYEAEAARRG